MWHAIQVVGHYRGFRSATSTRFNLKITFAGVDVLFLDNYPDLFNIVQCMLLFPTFFYSREWR